LCGAKINKNVVVFLKFFWRFIVSFLAGNLG